MPNAKTTISRSSLPLRARVTCPHCWHSFAPGEILWISAHPELQGDPCLGGDAQQRFLPTRFTVDGLAIDVKGVTCKQVACPNCHLVVPRALTEMAPVFISTLGAPSSGKSYFLASMTWQMRQTLAKHFRVNFGDADPVLNQILNEYEETLFLNSQSSQLVKLKKTDLFGEWYNSVNHGGRAVSYPKPFVFFVQPQHPRIPPSVQKKMARGLCLYDNAGESFMPGEQAASGIVTQHLALSRALLFLFDPTQHAKFRQACQGKSGDPQIESATKKLHRQDQVILEAANRIRNQIGLGHNEKYSRPVVVVVTKYDAWSSLTSKKRLHTGWVVRDTPEGSELDVTRLKELSNQIRKILSKFASEVVTAVEAFAEDVTYIPVSSLGCSPEVDKKTGELRVRPGHIDPQFAEIPLLYVLHRTVNGLIPVVQGHSSSKSSRRPKSRRSSAEQRAHGSKPAERPEPRQRSSKPQQEERPPVAAPEAKPASSEEAEQEPGGATYLVETPQETYLSDPAAETHLADPAAAGELGEPEDGDQLRETAS